MTHARSRPRWKREVLATEEGSRIVQDDSGCILLGQPPEVRKGLILNNITRLDTLVLTEIKEKDGSLKNNLEFPIYFFLFVAKGLQEGRKLNMIGTKNDISQALRLMRYTLMGPTRAELDEWGTEAGLKKEWLDVAAAIALKDNNGDTIPVEGLFNLYPFEDDEVNIGTLTIKHLGADNYQIDNADGSVSVNLNQDTEGDMIISGVQPD